ncbi:MAG: hypothetical protein V1853_00165 [bacterium]
MKNQKSKGKSQNFKSKFKSLFASTFYFLIVFLTFNFLLLTLGQANAQTVLPLIVAPARQQLDIAPGEKSAVIIKFYNSGDLPVSGILKAADFLVTDKEGTPVIVDNPLQSDPKYSASSWFNLPYDRITIAPNDKVTIQANINIPVDAHPGGRYVAIYFEPSGNIPEPVGANEEAGTAVGTRIAGLVYLKVAGEISEKALVSRFFAPSFFEYGPVKVETEILNRGDYHIAPRGVISLINIFGGVVDQQKLATANVFPDASRSFTSELGKKWLMGRYKVNLLASYGNTGQALTSEIYVWVFPWKVATAIVLIIIIFIFLISNFYKKFVTEESHLEEELEKEKEEIEKLKQQLRKRG